MHAIETLLHPFDRLRLLWLKAASPLIRPLIIDREKRIAIAGTFAITLSFAATIVAPLWLLSLGPIFLGVLHLLADARYLVARTGLYKRLPVWLAVGVPLIWVAEGSWVGFLATVSTVLVARASVSRKLIALALIAPIIYASYLGGRLAEIIFVHAHNFVAVALFFWWTKRTTKAHYLPLFVFFFLTALIMLGVGSPVVYWAGGDFAPGTQMDLAWMALVYSPTGVSPEWALRFLLMYAFAQSVHYTIWLRLIPEEDRERATPRTFVQTYRALKQDLGFFVLWIFLLLALVIAVWALFDISAARMNYLEFARFHGYVELAIAALLVVEGRHFAARES
jgi:hypothetical protein